MSCEMDFTNYPYDSNTCPLELYELGKSNFESKQVESSKILINQFTYVKEEGVYDSSKHGIPFQVFVSKHELILWEDIFVSGVDITINRKSTQILSSYFVPTMAYVMVSWISFTISKNNVSNTTSDVSGKQKSVLVLFGSGF